MNVVGVIDKNIGLLEDETYRPLKVELVYVDVNGNYILNNKKKEYIDIKKDDVSFKAINDFNRKIFDYDKTNQTKSVIFSGEVLVVGYPKSIYDGYQESFNVRNRKTAVRSINTLKELELYKEALDLCNEIKSDSIKYKECNYLLYVDNKVKELNLLK